MPTSKPLRAWLAASGADQIVVDPLRRLERAEPTAPRRSLRADPTELAAGWAARLEKEPRAAPEQWIAAEAAASGPGRSAGDRGGRWRMVERPDHRAGAAPRPRRAPTATATSSTPPRACRSATRRRSSPPRTADVTLPLQPRRQRHRRPHLLRDRRRPRQRPPDDDRHRRPRPAPRHRRPRRPARRLHPGPDRRHRQRRRRHLPLPAPGSKRWRARSSRPCSAPHGGSKSERRRLSSTCPTCASSPSPTSQTP